MEKDNYEVNSYASSASTVCFYDGLLDEFTEDDIKSVFLDPILNHELACRISRYVYSKNGVVANGIDYMTSLPCLDRIVTPANKQSAESEKFIKNKELMTSALDTIQDKVFIRDALHTEMVDGTCFYYLETKTTPESKRKTLSDWEVEGIYEINEMGINATIITLPYSWCKIVGKKNGRYVVAFNLQYFNDFTTTESLENKLRKYPKEIRDSYLKWKQGKFNGNNWIVLDNDKTICKKIKCKDSEPWGRPLAICALDNILYQDHFINTKRQVLDDLNNKVVYETFPEGREKGTSALTNKQQETQHNQVKTAIMNKNNIGGTSFFSVAAGTKLDTLDISTDIFDEKYENNLNDNIALGIGISAVLLGASSKGNYASSQQNLEMITAQLYQWVYDLQEELNYVINKNIIKDNKNKVKVFYFPTSFANRNSFFEQMKTLYGYGGSLSFLIASTGVNPDIYLSVLKNEYDSEVFDLIQPHPTNYTYSAKNEAEVGRRKIENPTNESTIKSQANGSNNQPKPQI